MAERIVGYRLKLFADDNNLRVMETHAKAVIKNEQNAQAQREKVVQSANKKIAESYKGLNSQIDSIFGGGSDNALSKSTKDAETKMESLETASKDTMQSIDRETQQASQKMEKLSDSTDEASRAQDQLKQSTDNYNRAMSRVDIDRLAESTGKMASGFAMLSLVGEESTQKVVDGLLTIQASVDLFIGSVQSVQLFVNVWKGYKAAVAAAAVAQTGASASNVRAIAAETKATDALAAARGRAAIAGQASQASGASGGVGSAGGEVAEDVAEDVGGGLLARYGPRLLKFGARAGGVGLAIGGGLAVGKRGLDLAGTVSQHGFMGGATPGSYDDSVGGSVWNPYAQAMTGGMPFMPGTGDLGKARTRGAELDEKIIDASVDRAIKKQNASEDLTGMLSKLDATMGALAAGEGASIDERSAALAKKRESLRNQEGKLVETAQIAGGVASEKMAVELQNRKIELLKEEKQIRQDAGDELIAGAQEELAIQEQMLGKAQESLSIAKDELATTKQAMEADKERLMSAKERFGAMSKADQQELIRIKQKADKFGAGSLDREEAAMIDKVGLEGTRNIAREANISKADPRFDKLFGDVERPRLGRNTAKFGRQKSQVGSLQDRINEINANIELKNDFIVDVQQDTEEVVNKVKQAIREAQGDLNEQVRKVAVAEYKRMQGEQAQTDSKRREAQRASMTGAANR